MKTGTKSEFNGVDTTALKKTVGQISQQPELARCEFRLHNEWVAGGQNRSSTGDFYAAGAEQRHKQTFRFQADEPVLLEGKDEGANPVEFLLSALSACMTTTIAYYAALNGIKIERMESDYKGDLDLRGLFDLDKNIRPGYQKIRVNFRIKTDGTKEQLEKFYRFSPVYDVVSKSVPVETTIETY
jgi:uncharacterized OsmC-like protein